MNKNLEISLRLREFGEKKFSTMTEFAIALNTTPQGLTKYLNGSQQPGNIIQQRLRLLGCDIEWLMTGKTTAEYLTLEENSAIQKLKEELEIYKGENEAFRRSLSSEVVAVILQTAKQKDRHGRNGKGKMQPEGKRVLPR